MAIFQCYKSKEYLNECAKLNDEIIKYYKAKAVADLGFSRGGCANPKGGRQPTICLIFPKNCMKMKKFWPRGGASLAPPLRSTTEKIAKNHLYNPNMYLHTNVI